MAHSRSLEDELIDAGIPVVLDSACNLLIDETRERLANEGILDEAARGKWSVQKYRGSCFIFDGGSCAGKVCVVEKKSLAECKAYVKRNCTDGKC